MDISFVAEMRSQEVGQLEVFSTVGMLDCEEAVPPPGKTCRKLLKPQVWT